MNKINKNKIMAFGKELTFFNQKINLDLLTSSFTFYLLLGIFPLMLLINNILIKLKLINGNDYLASKNIFIGLILIINLIWTSSKLTNNLLKITTLIYFKKIAKSSFKRRIMAVILTIIFLLVATILIIMMLYLGYLKTKISPIGHFLINLGQFIAPFIFLVILISIIYKYLIPIKIKLKKTLIVSLIITTLLFLITIIYQNFFSINLTYHNLYHLVTNFITFLIWLYLVCYLFLNGIIILFITNNSN